MICWRCSTSAKVVIGRSGPLALRPGCPPPIGQSTSRQKAFCSTAQDGQPPARQLPANQPASQVTVGPPIPSTAHAPLGPPAPSPPPSPSVPGASPPPRQPGHQTAAPSPTQHWTANSQQHGGAENGRPPQRVAFFVLGIPPQLSTVSLELISHFLHIIPRKNMKTVQIECNLYIKS